MILETLSAEGLCSTGLMTSKTLSRSTIRRPNPPCLSLRSRSVGSQWLTVSMLGVAL